MAATVLETGVDGEESSQSESKLLPVSVIVEHILPLLDRVSRNRLCSTYKELHAASRKVHTPWPFKRRGLHTALGDDIYSVAFSPSSELLASGGSDRIIRIWDRADGRFTHLVGHTRTVNDLCFSPDEKLLASASADSTIRLWRLQDRSSRVLEDHGSGVLSVAFSRDGATLVSGDCLGNIRLWDVKDARCIRELVDVSIVGIFAVTFTPDGKTIATAGVREGEDGEEYGGIFLWDISDAEDISSNTFVDTHDDIVHSLEYSPDGRYLATGAVKGFRLWNALALNCAIGMTGNSDPVYSIAFSPNGRIVASASADGSVRLWSVEDGEESCLINLLRHHESDALSVAFSPDGQTLASSGRDGTVHLWNPHEEDLKHFKQVNWEKVFLLWNFRTE